MNLLFIFAHPNVCLPWWLNSNLLGGHYLTAIPNLSPTPTSATREKEGPPCSLAEISTVPGTWLEVIGKSKGRVC